MGSETWVTWRGSYQVSICKHASIVPFGDEITASLE